jgi:hypothetical protein
LKEAFGIEQSFDQGLEFSAAALVVKRGAGRDGLAVIVDVPRREVFRRGERSPVGGGDAVADDVERREAERHGELTQVGLELTVRGGQIGVLRSGLLEFEEHEGQSVDEEHDVEASCSAVRTVTCCTASSSFSSGWWLTSRMVAFCSMPSAST